MTDFELLGAAAKAADIELGADRIDCGVSLSEKGRHRSLPKWNPLTDDGDALRLAVKLRFDITFIGNQACVNGIVTGGADDGECCRRAIVRAAALLATEDRP